MNNAVYFYTGNSSKEKRNEWAGENILRFRLNTSPAAFHTEKP